MHRLTEDSITPLTEATSRQAADMPADLPITIIHATHGWRALHLGEIWARRELLLFLAWRDVAVRYKQMALGVIWAVLTPLITMLMYTLVFSKLARLPSEGIPYPLFVFSAMLPWNFFSGAANKAASSLQGNANLLGKVYFPRLILPISAMAVGLVDFAVACVALGGLLLWYGVPPSWGILLLPVLLLQAVLAALAMGIWFAAISVRYRDALQLIPFLLQVLMFASPVVYSPTMIPAGILRTLYNLNPMVGVVQGYRWALVGGTPPDPLAMVTSVGVVLVLLVGGLYYFTRVEATFADVV